MLPVEATVGRIKLLVRQSVVWSSLVLFLLLCVMVLRLRSCFLDHRNGCIFRVALVRVMDSAAFHGLR